MDNREYFNNLAYKWDQICHHDEKKLNRIIEMTGIKPRAKILDVGTGTGVLVKFLLATAPAKIVAIDIAENMIAVAQEKYPNEARVEFRVADIREFKEDGFDYIFLYSVYPHFDDKERLFSHLASLLKEDGKIVIAHSESKEKINARHAGSQVVKDDLLPAAEVTSLVMAKYFSVEKVIDDAEMYYLLGKKQSRVAKK